MPRNSLTLSAVERPSTAPALVLTMRLADGGAPLPLATGSRSPAAARIAAACAVADCADAACAARPWAWPDGRGGACWLAAAGATSAIAASAVKAAIRVGRRWGRDREWNDSARIESTPVFNMWSLPGRTRQQVMSGGHQ